MPDIRDDSTVEAITNCPVCNTKLSEQSYCMFCDDDVWFISGKVIWRSGIIEDDYRGKNV